MSYDGSEAARPASPWGFLCPEISSCRLHSYEQREGPSSFPPGWECEKCRCVEWGS